MAHTTTTGVLDFSDLIPSRGVHPDIAPVAGIPPQQPAPDQVEGIIDFSDLVPEERKPQFSETLRNLGIGVAATALALTPFALGRFRRRVRLPVEPIAPRVPEPAQLRLARERPVAPVQEPRPFRGRVERPEIPPQLQRVLTPAELTRRAAERRVLEAARLGEPVIAPPAGIPLVPVDILPTAQELALRQVAIPPTPSLARPVITQPRRVRPAQAEFVQPGAVAPTIEPPLGPVRPLFGAQPEAGRLVVTEAPAPRFQPPMVVEPRLRTAAEIGMAEAERLARQAVPARVVPPAVPPAVRETAAGIQLPIPAGRIRVPPGVPGRAEEIVPTPAIFAVPPVPPQPIDGALEQEEPLIERVVESETSVPGRSRPEMPSTRIPTEPLLGPEELEAEAAEAELRRTQPELFQAVISPIQIPEPELEDNPPDVRTNVGAIETPAGPFFDRPPSDFPGITVRTPPFALAGVPVAIGRVVERQIEQATRNLEAFTFAQAKELSGEELTDEERNVQLEFYLGVVFGVSPTARVPVGEIGPGLARRAVTVVRSRVGDFIQFTREKLRALGRQIVPRFRQPQEYIAFDAERSGNIAIQRLRAERLTDPLRDMGSADRLAAGAALRGQTEGIKPEILNAVRPIRQEIDRLTTELAQELDPVANRALIEEMNRNIGVYIRRVYGRDILGRAFQPTDEAVVSARAYLKDNLRITDPATQRLRPATEFEIKNAIENIVAGRQNQISVGRAGARINLSPLKRRGEIPKPIRDLMGEVEEGAYAGARTIADLSATLSNTRFFRNLAQDARFVSDVPKPGFTRRPLPDTPQLGALRGKHVSQEIADDINDMVRNPGGTVEGLYLSWLNAWKFSKTVLNPVTHFRNVLGNVTFADFAGIDPFNPRNWKWYRMAARELLEEGPVFQAGLRDAAIGTELIGTEIRQSARPILEAFVRGRGGPVQSLFNGVTKATKDAAWVYNLEDQIFKMASYMERRAAGLSGREAAAHVNRWFPNYRDVGPLIRRLRQTPVGTLVGSPFISFTSEAIRIYGNAMKAHPVKLAKWAIAIPSAITAYSAYSNGLTVEDVNDIRESLPETQRSRYLVLLPWKDREGSLKTVDISFVLPLGDMLMTQGLLQLPIVQQFVGGNPLITTIAEIAFNRRVETDGPIARPSDVSEILSLLGFAAQELLPVPTPVTSVLRQISRGPAEFGGREPTPTERFMRLVSPFRTRPLDVSMLSRRIEIQKERREILTDLRRSQFAVAEGRMRQGEFERREAKSREAFEELREEFETLERATALVGGIAGR